MRRRIARLVEPLRLLLRRPRPRADVSGPAVRHHGSQPPSAADLVPVPGIGLGSLGMPRVDEEGAR
ncbi:hypothetical protein GCM10010254_37680 [Streptomyces chromofuscus]|uniref:Uncharacterized protein n=1 Tax=Streptomyces chromofuscus TaxID=42881 RepID=A0A7M2TE70_STRCW|nr:hypothetical protein [Streptomyces chromofuscus]QOV46802.1 hypothetical protein IPT68_13480 [Streptomyces chromofuscus]GGT13632.1 hypothetical protein GCM10010254_37680 [Streptomyces chromofuscus]